MPHDIDAQLRNGTRTMDPPPRPQRNEIVVYQPDETLRLDVRLENETVWLTQGQMASLFGCSSDNVGLHLRNIYSCGELSQKATAEDFSVVRLEGSRSVRRRVCFYNLDAIISVGYRVNSIRGVRFRQWATSILKDYLLRGYALNERLVQIEDRMDRRLAEHGQRLDALEDRVDFFVRTQTPPLQGVFYDGQLWDARALVLKLVASAKRSLILIDNWATAEVLDLFAKKREGVDAAGQTPHLGFVAEHAAETVAVVIGRARG